MSEAEAHVDHAAFEAEDRALSDWLALLNVYTYLHFEDLSKKRRAELEAVLASDIYGTLTDESKEIRVDDVQTVQSLIDRSQLVESFRFAAIRNGKNREEQNVQIETFKRGLLARAERLHKITKPVVEVAHTYVHATA